MKVHGKKKKEKKEPTYLTYLKFFDENEKVLFLTPYFHFLLIFLIRQSLSFFFRKKNGRIKKNFII